MQYEIIFKRFIPQKFKAITLDTVRDLRSRKLKSCNDTHNEKEKNDTVLLKQMNYSCRTDIGSTKKPNMWTKENVEKVPKWSLYAMQWVW